MIVASAGKAIEEATRSLTAAVQWHERWPLVVEGARAAIEEATRPLTAAVAEMQQHNVILRQRVSYLEHELAFTKDSLFLATSDMIDEQQ